MKERGGVLDYLDRFFGRFSDSDTANGKRRRSWGVTVMFWLSMPLVLLVMSQCIIQMVFAYSHVPRIPKDIIKAYRYCIEKTANQKSAATCKLPSAFLSKVPLKVSFGRWPWIGSICMFGVGVFFCLMRRKQDFDRFKEAVSLLSLFVDKPAPDSVMEAVKATAHKLVGEKDEGPKRKVSQGM